MCKIDMAKIADFFVICKRTCVLNNAYGDIIIKISLKQYHKHILKLWVIIHKWKKRTVWVSLIIEINI